MHDWIILHEKKYILGLGGKHRPYHKTIDLEKWMMDKELYYFLDQIRRAVFNECCSDFLNSNTDRHAKYKISFKIEKLEGECNEQV